ncbi:hypothetical protein [Halolamina sp. C58]|uniref:hypothetical protein n=1 Tax=Halolamina sp. C58 TaxID=3421640 RepID=UPI003EB8D760
MVSNTRLYGAAIAAVSGGYSLWSASMGAMGTGGWLMAVLGAVVLVHGALLLTDYADRLGDASGPLMIAYAVLMLLNQALLGSGMMDGMGGGMGGGMQGGMPGPSAGMGWDAGMVALALLMLLSGVIMTQSDSADDGM